jgi:DNA-binding protein HU-beta
MHQRELVARVAGRTSLTQKQAREALDAILEITTEALIGGAPVTLTGFGRFELREYKGRRVHHPQTRQPCDTESRLLPAFHPYPVLKRRIREADKGQDRRVGSFHPG